MQIIYAVPFVLISIIAFAIFGAIPRLRPYALTALVAPAAFGFWALIGYVTWVLVCVFVLKIQLRPVQGAHGIFDVILFFIMPGLLGAWASLWILRRAIRYIKGSKFLNQQL